MRELEPTQAAVLGTMLARSPQLGEAVVGALADAGIAEVEAAARGVGGSVPAES